MDRRNKFWNILSMECCSAVRRDDVLTLARTLMNLKSTMSRGGSQTHKASHCRAPLIRHCRNSKTTRTGSRERVPGAQQGAGEMRYKWSGEYGRMTEMVSIFMMDTSLWPLDMSVKTLRIVHI